MAFRRMLVWMPPFPGIYPLSAFELYLSRSGHTCSYEPDLPAFDQRCESFADTQKACLTRIKSKEKSILYKKGVFYEAII